MNMSLDHWMLVCIYLVSSVAFLLIQKKHARQAQICFIFQQLLNWILGLCVVEAGWIEYPVREFQIATHTSFAFEYFVFPVITAYFNIFFPEKRHTGAKIGYYLAFTLGITIPEIFIVRYTQLIKYIHWEWYWTFISIWISFYISRRFYLWFFASGKRISA